MTRAVLGLLVVLTLAACGVGTQPGPERVDIPQPSTSPPSSPGALDGPRVTVWFVRGSDLEAADRPTERPGIGAALDALVAGPTRAEVVDGLRTALPPQSLMPERPGTAAPVVTVAVSHEFTEIAGGNQLLATAQVVFTVTEFPGVESVQITVDGSPVEVPTDEGLTAGPVDRADYASVDATVPSPTPAPAPPPGGGSGAATLPPAAPSTPGRRRRRLPPSGDVTGP